MGTLRASQYTVQCNKHCCTLTIPQRQRPCDGGLNRTVIHADLKTDAKYCTCTSVVNTVQRVKVHVEDHILTLEKVLCHSGKASRRIESNGELNMGHCH